VKVAINQQTASADSDSNRGLIIPTERMAEWHLQSLGWGSGLEWGGELGVDL
jgi:hypothetical protein